MENISNRVTSDQWANAKYYLTSPLVFLKVFWNYVNPVGVLSIPLSNEPLFTVPQRPSPTLL